MERGIASDSDRSGEVRLAVPPTPESSSIALCTFADDNCPSTIQSNDRERGLGSFRDRNVFAIETDVFSSDPSLLDHSFFPTCILSFEMNRILLVLSLLLIPSVGMSAADSPPSATGAAMDLAASKLVASLSDADAAKIMLKMDDPRRTDWNNIPKPERKGLALRDMSDELKDRTHDLLKASLSPSGYEKATRIMSLENNLCEDEKKLKTAPLRDPQRYFLTIFGTPDTTGLWGYSFEGHHLSLNFVVKDGLVIGDTPSFWGANPTVVEEFISGGPEVGIRTLKDEEQIGFDLINSLDSEQQKVAIVADKAPAEYRGGGQRQPPLTPPEGIPAADLTVAQQKTLWSLIEAYNSHLTQDVADANLAEIRDANFDRVYFGWWGATQPGVGHSYRVQGPTFVLEFVNYQDGVNSTKANHIHSVWRSLQGDFAIPIANAN